MVDAATYQETESGNRTGPFGFLIRLLLVVNDGERERAALVVTGVLAGAAYVATGSSYVTACAAYVTAGAACFVTIGASYVVTAGEL